MFICARKDFKIFAGQFLPVHQLPPPRPAQTQLKKLKWKDSRLTTAVLYFVGGIVSNSII